MVANYVVVQINELLWLPRTMCGFASDIEGFLRGRWGSLREENVCVMDQKKLIYAVNVSVLGRT